jgi:Holliday junction resolvasome RuvABC endonuclease subunit
MKAYIGIDNGVSGAIAISSDGKQYHISKMPVFKDRDYTKKPRKISRISAPVLAGRLKRVLDGFEEVVIGIERPMVNPTRFRSSVSALRALEATLIAIEEACVDKITEIRYIDSKQWSKHFGFENAKDGAKSLAKSILGREVSADEADALAICLFIYEQSTNNKEKP